MLDLTLFRNRTYAGANVVVLLVALAMFGVFFSLALHAERAGLLRGRDRRRLLPMTILIILVALKGRLSDRWGQQA